jgi:hypothetical protein
MRSLQFRPRRCGRCCRRCCYSGLFGGYCVCRFGSSVARRARRRSDCFCRGRSRCNWNSRGRRLCLWNYRRGATRCANGLRSGHWLSSRWRLCRLFDRCTRSDLWNWRGFGFGNHHLGSSSATHARSGLWLRRWGLGRCGGPTTATRSGGRSWRCGPGALFTLPARADSRDLIICQRTHMTAHRDVHLPEDVDHLVSSDSEFTCHVRYTQLTHPVLPVPCAQLSRRAPTSHPGHRRQPSPRVQRPCRARRRRAFQS